MSYSVSTVKCLFEKCEVKKGKSRYNHQTGFCRKMKQYKERTNDAIAIIFYQSTKVRTQIEDAVNMLSTVCTCYFDWSLASTSITHTLNLNEIQQLTSTPSKRPKKMVKDNKNAYWKCFSTYGSKMDIKTILLGGPYKMQPNL